MTCLPPEFVEYVQFVNKMIEIGDESATIPSDDLLQCDAPGCGGLIEQGGSRYQIEFYPNEKPANIWRLELRVSDIAAISEGLIGELTLWGCEDPACGRLFSSPHCDCFDCDYREDERFGEFTVPDAIVMLNLRGIDGISSTSSRSDVITILGDPEKIGGGYPDSVFGYIFPWIKYFRSDCQVRFEFTKNARRIRKVCFLEKDWAPISP